MADKKKAPVAVSSSSSSSLDVESLRQIVEIVEASEITKLIWRSGDQKLIIRRGPEIQQVLQAPAHGPAAVHVVAPSAAAPAPTPSAPRSAPRPAAASAPAPAPEKKGHIINSPFVGTFYRTPAPDQPAFVEVGAPVRKGQVLCIIEAMKLMNEIESEVAGKVAEVLVPNATPVEFGQPLFRIESA
jgi:acetyl-CoA carboxylase biotin carboxyl carrier protein